MNRRALLRRLGVLAVAPWWSEWLPGSMIPQSLTNQPLPPRGDGELDIHHIDTGRGNCTLVIGPDGTSIMIDAGASNSSFETSGQPRPNGSLRPGEWQGLYAKRHGVDALDYLIVTHLHPDHIGDVSGINPASKAGPFRLTGVSDVDALVPIQRIIDRAYPDYGSFPPPASPCTDNYLAFLNFRRAKGRSVERASVGSTGQVRLRDHTHYPGFSVRVLAANGSVWSGSTSKESEVASRLLLPDPSTLNPDDRPNENLLSIAIRLSYGDFSYFSGGDLSSSTRDGRAPWMDIETAVAKAAGRTEVAVADHHGYFDACGPGFVQNLDAQVYIVQAWDVGHPGTEQLQRMLGAWSNKPTHDLLITDMLPANELINRRFAPLVKSRQGHVVVRVSRGGEEYRIYVLDSSADIREMDAPVKAVFGPYKSRH